MKIITPEEREKDLEADRAALMRRLKALHMELEKLESRVLSQDLGKKTDVSALMGDIRFWLKQVRETENHLGDIKKERAGVAGSYGVDLDVARVEIGCRLARIRRCCDAGRLPG